MFERISAFSAKRVELFGAQYKAFGVLGLINFPVAYFILNDAMHQNESFILRLSATILCIPLIFHQRLPNKFQKYLPLYWHGTLIYALTFFCTYMLLQNNFSLGWLTNASLGLFLFVLLVDWLVFVILVLLGAGLGVLVYAAIHGFANFYLQTSIDDLSLACNQYSFIIIIGIFFSRHKEIVKLKERVAMESLAATMAHELRTPLASIVMIGESLKRQLPIFTEQLSNQKEEEVQKAWQLLASVPERIQSTTRNAFMVIEMILMNLKGKPLLQENQTCLMSACIESALHEYPLEEKQKRLIHWDKNVDFSFKPQLWIRNGLKL